MKLMKTSKRISLLLIHVNDADMIEYTYIKQWDKTHELSIKITSQDVALYIDGLVQDCSNSSALAM